MQKFSAFLKGLFTKNIPIKILAVVMAVVTVIFINI